jgi:transposase
VDYAGGTVLVFDAASGEDRRAHIFVAVLGASKYTYAEARWSEGLADWVGAHVNALAFLGGAPKLLVCDNLRAGVTAACRYEPAINRTYQEWPPTTAPPCCRHGSAAHATRPRWRLRC